MGVAGRPGDERLPYTRRVSFIENLKDWQGKDVVDVDGEKVGRLTDAYYDAETDVAQFLVVETGKLRKHQVLIPAGGISAAPDHLTVAVRANTVEDAPTVDEGEMTREAEQAAFEHYGYTYTPASTASGRRLVRR